MMNKTMHGNASSIGTMKLSVPEFKRLSRLVYDQCGINLSDSKKIMLESRLNKRLRALKMISFKDYIYYLSSSEGMQNELVHMIDVVSTNKTDFFREPHHFDFLSKNILLKLIAEGKRKINVWSAACSTGEEPYTLAMVLQDFVQLNSGFDYTIFASDISTDALQKAVLGVYPLARATEIPMAEKKKYFLKSKNTVNATVKVIPELRVKVRFERINFMDAQLPVNEMFDVVFCRNALIYFDRKTQQEVVNKLLGKLKKGGYLFIGHSESLYQLDLPIVQIKPTIYLKP
jgi:chemotaxis protein methyltransferase CheR